VHPNNSNNSAYLKREKMNPLENKNKNYRFSIFLCYLFREKITAEKEEQAEQNTRENRASCPG